MLLNIFNYKNIFRASFTLVNEYREIEQSEGAR